MSYTRFVDVDWRHGAEHMWLQHEVSAEQADEALEDVDSIVAFPDPKSRSGRSARVIGYSPSAGALLTVILVRRADESGLWWGATGWRSNGADRRIYWEQNERNEDDND
jgi:hypothetical protein